MVPDDVSAPPTPPGSPRRASSRADFLYEAFFGGAIGASVIALFFLAVDELAGRPLFTPSLVGTSLFTDAVPSSITEVRLDMVGYFSAIHFAAFAALGAVVSSLCSRSPIADQHSSVVVVVVFAILTATIFLGDRLLMQGIVSTIGLPQVLIANGLTSVAMASFARWAHHSS